MGREPGESLGAGGSAGESPSAHPGLRAPQGDVTLVLGRLAESPAAAGELFTMLQDELRRMASGRMARERAGHTLDTGALMNETYLRLFRDGANPVFNDRRHFLAVAAEVMRHILIDHARRRRARAHQWKTDGTPAEELAALTPDEDRAEEISGALDALAEAHPRAADVVRLRYFAGCNAADVAELLGVSKRTVEYDWTFARAWIQRKIGAATPPE